MLVTALCLFVERKGLLCLETDTGWRLDLAWRRLHIAIPPATVDWKTWGQVGRSARPPRPSARCHANNERGILSVFISIAALALLACGLLADSPVPPHIRFSSRKPFVSSWHSPGVYTLSIITTPSRPHRAIHHPTQSSAAARKACICCPPPSNYAVPVLSHRGVSLLSLPRLQCA